MSSTSHALGPKEPPAPVWVMIQPYRCRSDTVNGPGSVLGDHDHPGRTARGPAAGGGARRPDGRLRARLARPRGTASAASCEGCPTSPPSVYDRRGYQGSRDLGTTDLDGHVDDLLGLAALAGRDERPGRGRRPQLRGRRRGGRGVGRPAGARRVSAPSNHRCPGWASAVKPCHRVGGAPGSPWPRTLAMKPSSSTAGLWARRPGLA